LQMPDTAIPELKETFDSMIGDIDAFFAELA
jgi:hypothetical protein